MFSTGDLSVDIVMVTIKKQEGEDPRFLWFNGNIFLLIVTSRHDPTKLRPGRLHGYDPILRGEPSWKSVHTEKTGTGPVLSSPVFSEPCLIREIGTDVASLVGATITLAIWSLIGDDQI